MATPPPKSNQRSKHQKYTRLSSRSPSSANEDSFDNLHNGEEGENEQDSSLQQQQNVHEILDVITHNNSTVPPSSVSLELSSFPINGQHHCEKSSLFEKCFPRRFKYLASHLRKIFAANFVDDYELLKMYRKLCCNRTARRVDNNSLDDDNDDEDDFEGKDDGGVALMKLLKLWTLVVLGILILHPFARWMLWEIDEDYTLSNFFFYDFQSVLADMLFFFIVGRLYQPHNPGIDSLFPWILFMTFGAIYPSVANNFEFLQHSLSMYSIMCTWPPILFVYAIALLVMAGVLIVGLVRSHYRRGVLGSRLLESIVLFLMYQVPFVTNDNFHLHHWYGMWWLGMQSNAPEWWIRCFMAYCLGCYINGIAVYGRDPILACEYAFYRSTNMECAFMECYEVDTGAGNETEYKPFVTPDWRTCTTDGL